MRVVIPVANENVNRSLPYAIASIHYHTDYDVLTVGGKDFGLCEHLDTGEPKATAHSKFSGEATALRIALEHLGEPFIYSTDDIYWLRPAEPIRWALGLLDDVTRRDVYGDRKRATAVFLQSHGLPTFDYESHTPLPILNLDALRQALTWCAEFPVLDKRSVYGNLTGEPDVIAPDVKLRKANTPTPSTPWVSTSGHPARYRHLIGSITT